MGKIASHFIFGIVCFAIGCAVVFSIFARSDNETIKRISSELAVSEESNTRLREENIRIANANSELARINRQSTETISRLESQLAIDNRLAQETASRIRNAINETATGLSEAGSGLNDAESAIDTIITGLSKISDLVTAIP